MKGTKVNHVCLLQSLNITYSAFNSSAAETITPFVVPPASTSHNAKGTRLARDLPSVMPRRTSSPPASPPVEVSGDSVVDIPPFADGNEQSVPPLVEVSGDSVVDISPFDDSNEPSVRPPSYYSTVPAPA